MFKSKTALLLAGIVAVLTLCSFTAKAQTKSDSLFRDSITKANDAHGHITLITDSALVDSAGKSLTILAKLPKANTPEAWAAYIVSSFFVLFGLYQYIQKKRLQNKPATPVHRCQDNQILNAKPCAPAERTPMRPVPPSPGYRTVGNYTEADIINQLKQNTVAETSKLPISIQAFTPDQINELRSHLPNTASDAEFSPFIKKLIDNDDIERNWPNGKPYDATYRAQLEDLYTALTIPAGRDYITPESWDKSKAVYAKPKKKAPNPNQARNAGGKFTSKKK